MPGYHSPQVDVPVRLNTNESPFAPPASFVNALVAQLSDVSWNRYPDRKATRLCSAIADRHGVSPSEVFVANGSNEVLQTILIAYGGAGRSVLVNEPGYQMHVQIAKVTGAQVHTVARRGDFTVDEDAFVDALRQRKPHVVFLTSPNNPTGLCDPEHLIDLALVESDAVVVVDEAYAEFGRWSALDRPLHDRVVITRTFSKTWSMAAARLGYAISTTAMVDSLWTTALPYHLDSVKQLAGVLALRFTDEMDERVAAIKGERDRLISQLRSFGCVVVDSDANFVLFEARRGTKDADSIWQELVDRGVLVRNCSSWSGLEGWLRVTIGTPQENDAFLGAMKEITHV